MATAHFSTQELVCHCGCGGLPPEGFQSRLEELRIQFGHPMVLSSAYRCPEHNAKVSSTGGTGPHTKGAVDVLCYGPRAHELVSDALMLGWTGIGVSQRGPRNARFVHLDDTGGPMRPCIWSY